MNGSVHSAGITEVHNVPMTVIQRPIPPVLDEAKVNSLMQTIQVFYTHTKTANRTLLKLLLVFVLFTNKGRK